MMSTWKKLGLAAVVTAFCAAGSLSFPSTSFAHDPMHPKLNVHFRLGLAGEFDGRVGANGPVQRSAMEPGFGGGLEIEIPLNPFFSLGAAFEAYGWNVARAPGSYNVSLDLLFMPRLRIPFGDHPWHAEVYFGLPIGPTVSLPHERFAESMLTGPLEAGFGVTGGGRVGFRMNVHDLLGFFVDVGPMLQYVSHPTRAGGDSFDSWNYQFVIRAGGSFGLAS